MYKCMQHFQFNYVAPGAFYVMKAHKIIVLIDTYNMPREKRNCIIFATNYAELHYMSYHNEMSYFASKNSTAQVLTWETTSSEFLRGRIFNARDCNLALFFKILF